MSAAEALTLVWDQQEESDSDNESIGEIEDEIPSESDGEDVTAEELAAPESLRVISDESKKKKRSDRIIVDFDTALNETNYESYDLEDHEVTFTSKKDKDVLHWSNKPPVTAGRNNRANIMTEVPGPRPAAKRAKTVADCWSLFFTDGMLETIVTHTNDKIRRIINQLGKPSNQINAPMSKKLVWKKS